MSGGKDVSKMAEAACGLCLRWRATQFSLSVCPTLLASLLHSNVDAVLAWAGHLVMCLWVFLMSPPVELFFLVLLLSWVPNLLGSTTSLPLGLLH